jgi:hypothetical protein
MGANRNERRVSATADHSHTNMKHIKPESLMLAHQYLYYVKARPIWSDYDYDMWCRAHGFMGGGGSDSERDYDYTIKVLADDMGRHPSRYPCKYDEEKAMNYTPPDEPFIPTNHEQTK